MKFETKELNYSFGLLQIPLPKDLLPACERLVSAVAKDKPLQVEITVKRKKRSLTANAALWAMLQDLAVAHKTTAEEIYLKALRDYGFYEDIAIVPSAAHRLQLNYRIVEPTGDVVYGARGRMEVYKCWPGSSTYNTKQFSHLLDMVIEDAKSEGIDFISEADKALLMEEWEQKHGT